MTALSKDLKVLDNLANFGWPPPLPIELALGVLSPQELKAHYEIDDDAWSALPNNPAFMAAVQHAVDQLKQEGMGFKMRARLLAEANLHITQQLINEPMTPASVRKDLVVAMARWAGYDDKAAANGNVAAAAGAAFQINILLGNTP
jgi:hypothetical protein